MWLAWAVPPAAESASAVASERLSFENMSVSWFGPGKTGVLISLGDFVFRYSPPLPGLPALSAPLRAPPLRPPDAASGCTRPKAAAGPAAGTGSCGAGFDAYLVKPIELDSLLAVLDSVGKSTRPH